MVLRADEPGAAASGGCFSDLNPWMLWVKSMAETVRANRRPVAPDNPFVKVERDVSDQIEEALDQYRDARDDMSERMFKAIYESPWLAAAVGVEAGSLGRRGPQSAALGAGRAEAPQAQGARVAHRGGDAARRLGAAADLRAAGGRRRRRAAVQHGPPHDRGAEAGERAVARRAEGRDQAAGVRRSRWTRSGRSRRCRSSRPRCATAARASTSRGR